MFAPNHQQTASELLRVCKPGGTIALASWTPDGFIGELFKTVSSYVPPPAGVQSPLLWATERHLRHLFGEDLVSLEVKERIFTYRFPSAEDFVAFFRTWYGPTVKAFAALDDRTGDALERDLVCAGGALRQAGHTTRWRSRPPTPRQSRSGDERQRLRATITPPRQRAPPTTASSGGVSASNHQPRRIAIGGARYVIEPIRPAVVRARA